MSDWEQLRDVGQQVSPPPFASLVTTAGKRDRRARIVTASGTLALLAAVGIGIGLTNDDDGTIHQPVKDPTESVTPSTEEVTLPDGVLPLPEADPGKEYATLDAGRFRVPLDDTLAFEVDAPATSYAHEDGLFIATGRSILKTEVAGEEYGVPADACTAGFIKPVGPTIDDLVEAIRDEPVYQVSDPEPVELGGARGTYLEIRVPATYDASSCGGAVLLPGKSETKTTWEPGYRGHWWILDVEGQRVVVVQHCGCPAAVLDRATPVARSITFIPTR